jgi:hypothetical protein
MSKLGMVKSCEAWKMNIMVPLSVERLVIPCQTVGRIDRIRMG